MSVPEAIRSVERPKNTVVIDTKRNGPKRYAVRERSYIKYISGGNPQPRNGKIVGHIIEGHFVSVDETLELNRIKRLKNIPLEMKDNGSFCLWKYEQVNDRKAKIPYNPNKPAFRAATNKPETFTAYANAVKVLYYNIDSFDGIGVRICDDLIGVDIDKVEFNEKGEVIGTAREIVEQLDAYTEISPSGKGLRIFCKADSLQFDKNKYFFMHNNIEIYIPGHTNRYLTVTGNCIRNKNLLVDRSSELQVVLDKYMTR